MTRSSRGLDTDRELDWRQFAACGPGNADWFFVTHARGHLTAVNRMALELCARCPVASECLADATSYRVDLVRIAGGQVIQDRPSRATTGTHPRRWAPSG